MDIMSMQETIIKAAEASSAELVIDYANFEKFKQHLKDAKHRKTDSVKDAVASITLTSKRALGVSGSVNAKDLALMKIPAVLISTAQEPVNYAINLYPESLQELYDDILCSYKLAEDRKNYLPVVIHTDSLMENTREAVEIMTNKTAENFLGPLNMAKPEKHFSNFLENNLVTKSMLQKSLDSTEKIVSAISDAWKKRTKRAFQTVDNYMAEQAEIMFLGYGSLSTNIKLAMKQLRTMNEKVGFIRIHMLRPVPDLSGLSSIKKLGVIDTEIALGSDGMLYHEVHDINPDTTSILAQTASVEALIQAFQHLKSQEKNERIWMID